MSAPGSRTYRFGDASRPGLLLGLSARQAIPVVAGAMWLAVCMQTPLAAPGGLVGLTAGCVVAFGRWRGAPLAETLVPAARMEIARWTGRQRWVRTSLTGSSTVVGDDTLPPVLQGIEVLEVPMAWSGRASLPLAVVSDRSAGTITGVLRAKGRDFPLASAWEQDALLTGWGAALTPFAREQSPVVRVTWQEWAHPVHDDEHRDFLASLGATGSDGSPELADYVALLDRQAPVTFTHDVLLTVTIDQRRIRARRRSIAGAGLKLAASIEALTEELRQFHRRLGAAGLTESRPLTPPELSAAVRVRSDPSRAAQVTALSRSLAAAAGRGSIEWGPMAVEPEWGRVRVDGALHRTYRIAGWPPLAVPGDWLGPLLTDARATRTVCVVMEPIPMSRASRAADREVMAREADAEMKQRKGFRVNARERRRLADVTARERELAQGHAEFRFVGLVDVSATDEATVEGMAGLVEQSAAQSLIDLRPLEARHHLGWVACLPLGRNVAGRSAL